LQQVLRETFYWNNLHRSSFISQKLR